MTTHAIPALTARSAGVARVYGILGTSLEGPSAAKLPRGTRHPGNSPYTDFLIDRVSLAADVR